jgi:uncharacterized membrane protein YozB (DUF420 family)
MDAPLDPKVLYWTGAFANLVVIAVLAVQGVRLAKAGEYARHARAMRAAAVLVGAFLLSYVLKLAFLGREEPGTWGRNAVWILRFHELCVLVMLVGGAVALALSRRLRGTKLFTRAATDPAAPPALSRRHRFAGRSAVIGALLGATTAALVLTGMYARARWVDAPALAQHEAERAE